MEGHSPKVRNSGAGRPVAMELLLRSGDMLFVPRGFVHKAAVQDGTSVHLTFGIPSPQSIELLDLLRTPCMQIDEFRKDVIAVVGPEALAEQGGRVMDRLVDNHSMQLGDLCDSFAGEIDADVVESTMQKLVTGRLAELAR